MTAERSDRERLTARVVALVESPHAGELVPTFLAALPASARRERQAPELARAAASLLELGEHRPAGGAVLRVVAPQGVSEGADRSAFLQVITDAMPFVPDSVRACLERRKLRFQLASDPLLLAVRRDEEGRLGELVADGVSPGQTDGEGTVSEQWLHLEIGPVASAEARRALEGDLEAVLGAVGAVVEDWEGMRAALRSTAERLEAATGAPETERTEAGAFLRWLIDDHFILLGSCEHRLTEGVGALRPELAPGSALGLLREGAADPGPGLRRSLRPPPEDLLEERPLLRVTKLVEMAPVHRNAPMDCVVVKRLAEGGGVVGEHRFVGLFASEVYGSPARTIPLVRGKLERVEARAGPSTSPHGFGRLGARLELLPREELLQASEEELAGFALRLDDLDHRPRPALLVRRDGGERFVSCLVFLPREHYGYSLRSRLEELLEDAFSGRVVSSSVVLPDRSPVRLHLILRPTEAALARPDLVSLEEQLRELAVPWSERLEAALGGRFGWAEAATLGERYRAAFSTVYQETFSVEEAAADVALIERVLDTGRFGLRLDRSDGDEPLHLRVYEAEQPVPLQRVLSMLGNMGLEVATVLAFEVCPAGEPEPVRGRDLEMTSADALAARESLDAVEETLKRVWGGAVEDDRFNRLVPAAGLTWRQAELLRAGCRYLRQAVSPFSLAYMAETLAGNAALSRRLVECFERLFDPELPDGEREAEAARRAAALREGIRSVRTLDEERILGRLLQLVLATLRTNYYQRNTQGAPKEWLSLKLDPRRLGGLPQPRPLVETYVYAPRMEAIHMRGHRTARGGIRWSDRLEDLRTEVLSLYKAQLLKNTTIVAVGAKGGFVVRRPPSPADREAALREGVACYRMMLRGLLDLTDNRTAGAVVPPEGVVRRDGDDPYLVVATEKGTATFPDIANQVAREYGFWLGDAFASGGSVGYDHKKLGITARGTWEAVSNHLRELGRDPDTEPLTVVGVGDMSGDVFGNGMLLSRRIRLLGAFNHLHVLVDPDPDPEASWAERRRLFALPRSSWDDYRSDALSAGGAIYERHAKTVRLEAPARELLGLGAEEVTPDVLIRALLRAPVDLLWLGGIGIYVKASSEGHPDTGDRINDAVRIDATELRARVVGEAANLGLTQAARVEYALRGGRVNTDFLDSSGGVQCSDLEVNIKILLEAAEEGGDVDDAERDSLLLALTDEVVEEVLDTCREQSQAVSLEAFRAPMLLAAHRRLSRLLETGGGLDRAIEQLPDDAELERREAAGLGLTRPELAVLLAYVKMTLYGEILTSELPEDPYLEGELVAYFPPSLRERFRSVILEHRLRREILTARLTRAVVHRTGVSFVYRLAEESGRSWDEVARCCIACREILGTEAVWDQVEEAGERLPATARTALDLEIVAALERGTLWLLGHGEHEAGLGELVRRFGGVAGALPDPGPWGRGRRRLEAFLAAGVPEEVAHAVARLGRLVSCFDVATLAERTGRPAREVARLLATVDERLRLDLVPEIKAYAAVAGAPERAMVQRAEHLVESFRHGVLREALTRGGGVGALESFLVETGEVAERLEELAAATSPEPALLLEVCRALPEPGAPTGVS